MRLKSFQEKNTYIFKAVLEIPVLVSYRPPVYSCIQHRFTEHSQIHRAFTDSQIHLVQDTVPGLEIQ